MALAEFNRDNPFVILLRKYSEILSKETISIVKSYILSFVITLSTTTLLIYSKYDWLGIVLIILNMIILLFLFVYVLRMSDAKEVNNILYGNEYSNIYANNELINDLICKINEMIGRILILKEFIILYSISLIIIDTAILLRLMYLFIMKG